MDQIALIEFYLNRISRYHEEAHGVHQETSWVFQKVHQGSELSAFEEVSRDSSRFGRCNELALVPPQNMKIFRTSHDKGAN
jgi:hypothetical protein